MIREFIAILPQRARDRVRPDLLPDPREAEIAQSCKARRAISEGYREAQR